MNQIGTALSRLIDVVEADYNAAEATRDAARIQRAHDAILAGLAAAEVTLRARLAEARPADCTCEETDLQPCAACGRRRAR